MPVEVWATPVAQRQMAALRSVQRAKLTAFLADVGNRGCRALSYRLTGPDLLERLCVKHVHGQLRAVVAFENADRAWLVLVGPHDDSDPGIDVYTTLYALLGIEPPDAAGRTKPACCPHGEEVPYVGGEIDTLVEGARDLARSARRRRSR